MSATQKLDVMVIPRPSRQATRCRTHALPGARGSRISTVDEEAFFAAGQFSGGAAASSSMRSIGTHTDLRILRQRRRRLGWLVAGILAPLALLVVFLFATDVGRVWSARKVVKKPIAAATPPAVETATTTLASAILPAPVASAPPATSAAAVASPATSASPAANASPATSAAAPTNASPAPSAPAPTNASPAPSAPAPTNASPAPSAPAPTNANVRIVDVNSLPPATKSAPAKHRPLHAAASASHASSDESTPSDDRAELPTTPSGD